jgi:hypothetical protein
MRQRPISNGMKNKKTILWIGLIVIAIIGLIVWGSSGYEASAGTWEDTRVLCLPAGHANLGQHIHPDLRIIVDGEAEEIPSNIGVSSECMAETHTHDSSGEIHLETVSSNKEMTLGDFFAVWGESVERSGYETRVSINGVETSNASDVALKDHDQIVIEHTTLKNSAGTERIEASIGASVGGLGIEIEPLEVIEDSRCPIDVECIQAGTVRVRTLLTSGLGTANQIFELGQTITTEAEMVTLIAVSPQPNSTEPAIESDDYRFTFEIEKRTDI